MLAEGRGAYLPGPARWEVGSTYTYVYVTEDRLLWTDFLAPGRVWDLPLDLVTGYLERQLTHRYSVRLLHRPTVRVEWVPRRTFLWWEWGDREKQEVRKEATFMFSRRDTRAAAALRAQLSARGVAGSKVQPTRREVRRHERERARGRAVLLAARFPGLAPRLRRPLD